MRIFTVFLILGHAFLSFAQLTLSPIYTDHMVIQRDQPIVISGTGKAGKKVEVVFMGQNKSTLTDSENSWKIEFPPSKMNKVSQKMIVSDGVNEIVINHILIGDIWLCLGQSNMEWPVLSSQHYVEEKPSFKNLPMRFYNPDYIGKNLYGMPYTDSMAKKLIPEQFYNGHWQINDTFSMKTMSAVAYHFGKEITNNTGVPVGLINLSIGGAPIETFIDTSVLSRHPKFRDKLKNDWLNNNDLPIWIRSRAKENIDNLQNVPSDIMGKNHAFKPGFAFESVKKYLQNYAIRGMIFYQGESNAQELERVLEYNDLMKLMITDYRSFFKNPSLPFYYAQLSSIDTFQYKGHYWHLFREQQRNLMYEISGTGMAVTSDHGHKSDVHPRNKKVVGERLARWALHKVYNKNVPYFGPQPVYAEFKNNKLKVIFDKNLIISEGKTVKGFFINEKEPVDGILIKNAVLIDLNQKPEYICYGWSSYSEGNLTDKHNLPVSTFKLKVK